MRNDTDINCTLVQHVKMYLDKSKTQVNNFITDILQAKLKLTTSLQIYYKLLRMYQCPMSLEALRLDKFKLTEPQPDMGAAIDILVKHYKHIDVKEVISAS